MTGGGNQQRDRGLSLIELIVALSLFALVAVMGLQALTGMLRLESTLTTRAAESEDLSYALTLLRRDLRAAVPVAYVPSAASGRSALQEAGTAGLALSVGGRPQLPGVESGRFARVIWQHVPGDNSLRRQVIDGLTPGEVSIGTVPVSAVVLTGVRGMTVRQFGGETGWTALRPAATPGFDTSLPEAIAVSLDTDAWGPLEIVVSLK